MRKSRSFIVCLLAILVALLGLPAMVVGSISDSQENPALTVEEVLNRYAEACGGAELEKIKTETRTGTLVRFVRGQVPLTIHADATGKWYYNQLFAWGDQISYGYDGRSGWIQTTKDIGVMDADQLFDMRLLFDVRAPLRMKEFFPEMSLKGTEKVGEKEAVVIAAKSALGTDTDLAFDKETGLLLRAGEMFFEDYKDVGSIKRPFRILLGRQQGEEHQQMRMQFNEIKHNEAVDSSVFEVPSCALPVVEAPLYKTHKQFEPTVEAMDKCAGMYQHPERQDVKFRIFREDNHLFIELVGRGYRFEILPESEIDYYTRFLGWEFHFIKDEAGNVKELILNANTTIRTIRVN
jgi:hypothetical protein